MRWNPPHAEQQNGLIREYFVNITEEDTGREFQIMTGSPAAELQVQFLHPHYLYTLAVAAVTTAVGPFSYSVQAVTATACEFPRTILVPYCINLSRTLFVLRTLFLPPAPSSEPRNVIVANVTSTSIHFSWQPPLSEDQNGVITGYTLNVTSLETGETEELFTESTAYMLGSVNPHTLYAATVAAQTNAGRGPFSSLISVQTLEDGVLFIEVIKPHYQYI